MTPLAAALERIADDLLVLTPEDALCIAQGLVAHEFEAVRERNGLAKKAETIARLLEENATAERIAKEINIPIDDADTLVKYFGMSL